MRIPSFLQPLASVLYRLLIAYALYFVARIAYLLCNWNYFAPALRWSALPDLLRGSLLFDTSAILLTNIPVVVVLLLTPWKRLANWLFLVINSLALAANLADAVYFKYTLRRTTTSVFSEFQNEHNLLSIVATEFIHHWYLVLLFALIVWALFKRREERGERRESQSSKLKVQISKFLTLLVLAPLIVAGIRGGFTRAVRPITISNANQYVGRPTDAALVLNTPFALYRTIGKNVFTVPNYFTDTSEMEAVFSPVCPSHTADTTQMRKANVVIIIVESFGREYIGLLNKTLDHGNYRGYTPFTDSLVARSITFTHSYCNGRKSIDAMPSILSGIPMFVEPFFLTPASMNHVSGIASLLAAEGWHTAFFHGAQRGSMGFQAFSRATGFQHYYGREDYCADPHTSGNADFDGTWAIWDEPFLQYFAQTMGTMPQPFMTAVFTASSHHPYRIPDKYTAQFPDDGNPIHKCIRYTDMALGRFFKTASRQPWFRNTIFVITSDHTNLSDHPYYRTDLGGFSVPIIIYDASQQRQPAVIDRIAQQTDILPTVMRMLNYRGNVFAFGSDLLNTPPDSSWAVNYLNGIYQYVSDGCVLQFDGQQTRAVYSLSDSLMQHNLNHRLPQQKHMEQRLKAIIQQYMQRMTTDRLMP